MVKKCLTIIALSAFLSQSALAGEVVIEKVKVTHRGDTAFRFAVTLRHDDEGWEHYADLWQVLGPDEKVLGERILAHPHENEQPFTRSAVIDVPEGLETVTIRARDNVHGWAEETAQVTVPWPDDD
ncbi:MAG: hypothetical protein AAGH41_04575 [Pseudomonadota bacterium]